MKLNDIRVAHKLWGTILGLLLLLLAAAAFTQYRADAAMQNALDDVQRYESNISSAIRWQGLTETNTERSLAAIVTSDALLEKFFTERQTEGAARITEVQKGVREVAVSPIDKEALTKVSDARTVLLGSLRKLPDVKASTDPDARRNFALQEFLPTTVAYIEALKGFVKVQENQRNIAQAEALEARHNATLMGLGIAALVVVIGIWMALVLVNSITRPLARAVEVARAISAGDLMQALETDRKDEFGQLLRALSEMVTKLHGLVSEVRSGVESVSSASIEIANGNQDLSSRTEQTAANLQQTAASMEQLTSIVTQSADTARQANQLASTAAQAAIRGGEVVAQVVTSMQNISDASRKIADIIGTIDGIAFQTNILALNAAVEAARAGEQGRGFAVVASEVRSLAQRSAQAAKEIKTLIGASAQTVESGTQQVAQAGETMGEIVSSVRRVSDLIGEISASSTEQRDGIGQVNQAVNNLDQMTQQNAALVEESAAAAAGLRDQAQRLAEVVSVFNVGTRAKVATPYRAPPAPKPVLCPVAPPKKLAVVARPKTLATAPRKLAASTSAPSPVSAKGGEGDWEGF